MKEEFKFPFPSMKNYLFFVARQILEMQRKKLRLPKAGLSRFTFTIKPTNPLLMIWNFFKVIIILHTFVSFPLQDTFNDLFYA